MSETSSLTLDYLKRRVLWKEMYYFSLAAFIFALISFPLSNKLGIFTLFVIVGVWTKIPGFIHFSMNKIVVTDLLTFVLAVYQGFFVALLYIIITSSLGLFMGPKVWPFYVVRESIGFTVAALIISFLSSAENNPIKGFYIFLVIHYIIYYLLVVIFTPEEIPLEIMILPAVIFFDFIFTAQGFALFKSSIINMMSGEFYLAWVLLFFIGASLLIAYLAKKLFSRKNIITEYYDV